MINRLSSCLFPSLPRTIALLATALCVVGCGAPPPPAAIDGGSVEGGLDLAAGDGSSRAMDLALPLHPPLPQLFPHAGVVLPNINLVTVTFPAYPYVNDAGAFGDFVFTSKWFPTVLSEYGVKSGKHVGKFALKEMAPMSLTDAGVKTLIAKHIDDGTLPAPKSGFLYMLYFPSTSVISDGGSGGVTGSSCNTFAGYHGAASHMGTNYCYAVIADCGNGADDITNTASHELAEAATDPFPDGPRDGYFIDADPNDPWQIESGQENGDLCEYESGIRESAVMLQRSWSNAEAAAGRDPCIPSGDVDYANVFAVPAGVPTVSPGDQISFSLMGWTSGSAQRWDIKINQASFVDYSPNEQQAQLSAAQISPGETVTLTMTVPMDAKSGAVEGVLVESTQFLHAWPVAYQLK